MKDLRYIFSDSDFKKKAQAFTAKYFIQQKRLLLVNFLAGKSTSCETNHWKELKDDFWELQKNRCAICESLLNEIAITDIEHYRPKSHYWWLAYNYENYYVSCRACNSYLKREHFPLFDETKKVDYSIRKTIAQEEPLLLNPLLQNPEKYFRLIFSIYAPTGQKIIRLVPSKNLTKGTLDYEIAFTTIAIFNLSVDPKKADYHKYRLISFATLHDCLFDFAKMMLKVLEAKQRKEIAKYHQLKKNLKTYIDEQKDKNHPITEMGYFKLILKGDFEIESIPL